MRGRRRYIGILRAARSEKIFNSFYVHNGMRSAMYTSDIEFQQRGGSVGRSIFTHEARAEPRFPRIPDHSLPFPSPSSDSNAEMHCDRRSFFKDILDSITENLVTLSTSDRISSPHLSPLHNSLSDMSPGED